MMHLMLYITLLFTCSAEFQSCTLALTIQNWTVWWWKFKGSTHGVGTVWWELFSKQVDIWFSVSLFMFTYLNMQVGLYFCIGPMADLHSLYEVPYVAVCIYRSALVCLYCSASIQSNQCWLLEESTAEADICLRYYDKFLFG